MNIKKTIDLANGHKIEFGEATWDNKQTSIRNRYPTSSGGFSPRSSSELPINDLKIMMIEAIKNGYISSSDIKDILKEGINKL